MFLYQDDVLFPDVVVVAEGAEGGEEGDHDHHQRDYCGDQRVWSPLVGGVH